MGKKYRDGKKDGRAVKVLVVVAAVLFALPFVAMVAPSGDSMNGATVEPITMQSVGENATESNETDWPRLMAVSETVESYQPPANNLSG